MQDIILASNNQGKVDEFQQMLAGCGVRLLPQSDFNVTPVEETGKTFVENALLKARHASSVSGLPAIADDSGLAVDALNGAPGIYSARYAGEEATDQGNIEKLLTTLEGIPAEDRTARFVCALVYMKHAGDPCPLIFQREWVGEIIDAPRGEFGFGYDPVFFIPALNCTSAELAPDKKNKLSHRGKAVVALKEVLST